MKKLILATMGICALFSFSFAKTETEVMKKKTQLEPIVQKILKSKDYSEEQKEIVKSLILNCAKSNKNEVMKATCNAIAMQLSLYPTRGEEGTELEEKANTLRKQLKTYIPLMEEFNDEIRELEKKASWEVNRKNRDEEAKIRKQIKDMIDSNENPTKKRNTILYELMEVCKLQGIQAMYCSQTI